MDAPWPQWLLSSFDSAKHPQFMRNECGYYGPYARLLYHLFGVEGPFEITLQYNISEYREEPEALFTVYLDNNPVFFILVKPPGSISLNSKREQADDQMRNQFFDLHENVITPTLPGISAFGTRFALYEFVAATMELTPHLVVFDKGSAKLKSLAPADRWNLDILEPSGIAQIRKIVQDIRAACQLETSTN